MQPGASSQQADQHSKHCKDTSTANASAPALAPAQYAHQQAHQEKVPVAGVDGQHSQLTHIAVAVMETTGAMPL